MTLLGWVLFSKKKEANRQNEWMFEFCKFRCVDVWVSFFSSSTVFNFSVFMLAVVQGHYVMLIRAPHLEKCH